MTLDRNWLEDKVEPMARMFNSENLKVGDYIAVRMAQVFIIMVFVMGMISLGIELWTGSLSL